MANNDIKELSIGELFANDDSYLIPIYQRNYAWKKIEVEQLVTDINDYTNNNKPYYIGTLVVFQRNIKEKIVFETIDGQQRLTTLLILLSVLKNEFKKEFTFNHLLKYESREISTNTLKYIYNGNIEKQENLNPAMEDAYKVLKNYLKNIEIEKFKKYLLDNVKILRVNVPKDTDLNHYFEIMNNRGEQLEKHEVLKARMLEKLNSNDDKKVFNDIWEACSDMYRYVQYGFIPNVRDKIFGKDWNSFICEDFNKVVNIISPNYEQENESNLDEEKEKEECAFTIDDIINGKCKFDKDDTKPDNDKPDRFTPTISFPNFLLHILKITQDNTTPLDDKRLLDTFKEYDERFVQEFGYNLLKIRFLFDNYIIKREYASDKDEWSLKQAYKYEYQNKKKKQKSIQYKNSLNNEDKNKQILMILSMFHVSNPSQIYKYWLTGALNYLFKNYVIKDGIDADKYVTYLEKLAELFFKNRYLANKPQEFEDIIFNIFPVVNNEIECSKLNQGTSVEHFIFNYLDYLLWKKEEKINFNYFSFSFSNSVEHFYPQNPIDGHKIIEDKKILDNFGNLCLISVSKNTKLNNHPPKSKKAYYPNNQYDSLKQHIMMVEADRWDEGSIHMHQAKMLKFLELC